MLGESGRPLTEADIASICVSQFTASSAAALQQCLALLDEYVALSRDRYARTQLFVGYYVVGPRDLKCIELLASRSQWQDMSALDAIAAKTEELGDWHDVEVWGERIPQLESLLPKHYPYFRDAPEVSAEHGEPAL